MLVRLWRFGRIMHGLYETVGYLIYLSIYMSIVGTSQTHNTDLAERTHDLVHELKEMKGQLEAWTPGTETPELSQACIEALLRFLNDHHHLHKSTEEKVIHSSID